jgi:hypothetical protein
MNKLTTLMDKHRKVVAVYDTQDCTEDYEFQDEADNLYSDVKDLMKKMGTSKFFAYGLSLTWRNVKGYTTFETDRPKVLIGKLTPNSDFTLRIYETDNKGIYEVVCSHHDKPMGETLYLMSQSMAKKQRIMEQYF